MSDSEAAFDVSTIRSLTTEPVTPAPELLRRDNTDAMLSFALTATVTPLTVKEPAVTRWKFSNNGAEPQLALKADVLLTVVGACETVVVARSPPEILPAVKRTFRPIVDRSITCPAVTRPECEARTFPLWSRTSNFISLATAPTSPGPPLPIWTVRDVALPEYAPEISTV